MCINLFAVISNPSSSSAGAIPSSTHIQGQSNSAAGPPPMQSSSTPGNTPPGMSSSMPRPSSIPPMQSSMPSMPGSSAPGRSSAPPSNPPAQSSSRVASLSSSRAAGTVSISLPGMSSMSRASSSAAPPASSVVPGGISTNGQCGPSYQGMTCLGSQFGNCCESRIDRQIMAHIDDILQVVDMVCAVLAPTSACRDACQVMVSVQW